MVPSSLDEFPRAERAGADAEHEDPIARLPGVDQERVRLGDAGPRVGNGGLPPPQRRLDPASQQWRPGAGVVPDDLPVFVEETKQRLRIGGVAQPGMFTSAVKDQHDVLHDDP